MAAPGDQHFCRTQNSQQHHKVHSAVIEDALVQHFISGFLTVRLSGVLHKQTLINININIIMEPVKVDLKFKGKGNDSPEFTTDTSSKFKHLLIYLQQCLVNLHHLSSI
jgi:hypothetical protein